MNECPIMSVDVQLVVQYPGYINVPVDYLGDCAKREVFPRISYIKMPVNIVDERIPISEMDRAFHNMVREKNQEWWDTNFPDRVKGSYPYIRVINYIIL